MYVRLMQQLVPMAAPILTHGFAYYMLSHRTVSIQILLAGTSFLYLPPNANLKICASAL